MVDASITETAVVGGGITGLGPPLAISTRPRVPVRRDIDGQGVTRCRVAGHTRRVAQTPTVVETKGLEPSTPALQNRLGPFWSVPIGR